MPKAISEDLRKRVVSAYRKEGNAAQVAARFGVCERSVYRWDELAQRQGSLSSGYARCGRKSKIAVDAKFEAFAKAHMYSTLKQMAEHWETEVSEMTMSRSLAKLGWSRKKRPLPISKPMKESGKSS